MKVCQKLLPSGEMAGKDGFTRTNLIATMSDGFKIYEGIYEETWGSCNVMIKCARTM
ncbi:hypothetical protein A2U01_0084756 [Trifolium medium]|uniref:Uncharacterized protein n=1 Tax=Trifolium medium TaxID=97028 RepID=A0A392TQM2_9FABA|nr:hypothetical protein [Trifolium medium]